MLLFSDFESLDTFESSIYNSGLSRPSSETNLVNMGSHPDSSSRPVDMPSLEDSYYGSDTSLNLSGSSLGIRVC